jgi:hypothetical protein
MSFYATLVAQKGRMAAAKINYGVGLKVLVSDFCHLSISPKFVLSLLEV